MAEIINRSLVHIQTSKALVVAERRLGEEWEFEIAPGVKMVMCWIPPGEFLMGSPERGGSWNAAADDCRSSYRCASNLGARGYDMGFRVARSSDL